MRIDAHQHFWNYDPTSYLWIDGGMGRIRKDFLPRDLEPLLKEHMINGCVAVQARQNDEETQFLLNLAKNNPFIMGVVGWVDLLGDDLEGKLESYVSQPLMKGFRHSLQDEADPAFILQPGFQKGLRLLHKYNFTYDLLIKTPQFQATLKALESYNEMPVVLDHMAKPLIKTGEMEQWRKDIFALAKQDRVMCKLSGMVTEADWQSWKFEDLEPYLDIVLEAFGPERLMFGSDWPVCLVAAEYGEVIRAVERYISKLSASEQSQIMGLNAKKFYNL
ncbi:amidohydrolase [Anditalea andensis]|uniref:Amidohydrolase n=1 Tax=Anditalea andensis TaxID=1048983 RepID=A0A074KU40_9BACT|nr:amidohydrolase [Anditalea andensis]